MKTAIRMKSFYDTLSTTHYYSFRHFLSPLHTRKNVVEEYKLPRLYLTKEKLEKSLDSDLTPSKQERDAVQMYLSFFQLPTDSTVPKEYRGQKLLEEPIYVRQSSNREKPMESSYEDEQEYVEKQAELFRKNLKNLLEKYKKYQDLYVLFENGKILDADADRVNVAKRAYEKYGMRPLFIEKLTLESKPTINIWTPFF